MSYSNAQAQYERIEETKKAIDDQNVEEMVRLAKLYKKEGEDLFAQQILDLVSAINRKKELEDWDLQGKQAEADRKEREDERNEAERLPAEGNNY